MPGEQGEYDILKDDGSRILARPSIHYHTLNHRYVDSELTFGSFKSRNMRSAKYVRLHLLCFRRMSNRFIFAGKNTLIIVLFVLKVYHALERASAGERANALDVSRYIQTEIDHPLRFHRNFSPLAVAGL
jgi:hypothetical protein